MFLYITRYCMCQIYSFVPDWHSSSWAQLVWGSHMSTSYVGYTHTFPIDMYVPPIKQVPGTVSILPEHTKCTLSLQWQLTLTPQNNRLLGFNPEKCTSIFRNQSCWGSHEYHSLFLIFPLQLSSFKSSGLMVEEVSQSLGYGSFHDILQSLKKSLTGFRKSWQSFLGKMISLLVS